MRPIGVVTLFAALCLSQPAQAQSARITGTIRSAMSFSFLATLVFWKLAFGAGADALALAGGLVDGKHRDVVFAAAKNLKVIGRAGVGVDNIDRASATDHGVVVMNTPSGNTISTAEHAFALMLSLARNIGRAHTSMLAGKWERKALEGVEMFGKRLAILGMGRIGTEFAKRAQAFGMTVVAFDPFLTAARAQSLKVEHAESAAQALTGADVVTLHIPLTPETKHILDAERIALMNPGALIVNCARGGLVDEAALYDALKSGKVGGAGLDVFPSEPPTPLPKLPKQDAPWERPTDWWKDPPQD